MAEIVQAYPKPGKICRTEPIWQWDVGDKIHLNGIDLPPSYKAEFSNVSVRGTAKPQIQTSDTIEVPPEYQESGDPVYTWIVFVDENSRQTECMIVTPVSARSKSTDEEPTPVEQSEIDQAIAALNHAVEQTAADVEAAGGYAEEAEQSAESAATASENAIDAKEAAIAAKNTAETKATEADTSASNASTAAQNASMSASQADTSAQNAASSASAAETAKNAAQSAAQSVAGAMDTLEATIQADLQAAKESGEFDGKDGTTFTPAVSSEGVISWTNDGGLPNPQSQSIKGPVGATPNLTIGTVETLEPGADATAEITGTPENPVLNLSIPQGDKGEDADISNLAPIIVNSASGDIASFTDGAEDMPVKQLTVNVEPVQDLHGYDSPWPAGGGKNLTDYVTEYTPTVGINNGTVKLFSVELTAGETYTFSCKQSASVPTSTRNTLVIVESGGSYKYEKTSQDFNPTNLRHVYTFTATVTGKCNFYIWIHAPSVAATYSEWQVEKGSSFTGYAPYSNICPISGWTGAKVTRTGKNLWDEQWENGTLNASTGEEVSSSVTMRSKNFIPAKPGMKCIAIGPYNAIGTNQFIICYYDKDETYVNYRTLSKPGAFTVPNDDRIRSMRFAYRYYLNDSGGTYNHDVSINYPSTITTYEPYQGETYDIAFPSEAGTVYGGSLDVTNGVLTVDREIATITKDVYADNWFAHDASYSTWGFYCNKDSRWATFIGDIPTGGLISDKFPTVPSAYGTDATCCSLALINGEMQYMAFRIPKMAIDTPTDSRDLRAKIVEWLDSNPIQVCFKVTPTTYQLTPTEIKTLLGANNIWADTGNTSVTYKADTKLYIDKKFAELQALILEH